MNEDRTCTESRTNRAQPGSRPVRYEIVDKDGRVMNHKFAFVSDAAIWARRTWPDQEQDEDRTGKGWDVQVIRPAD